MPFLTKQDIAGLKRVFASLDTNRDGYLDPQELRDGLQGENFDESTVEFILQNADTDHDGKIGFGEFMRAAKMELPLISSSPSLHSPSGNLQSPSSADTPFSSKSRVRHLFHMVSGLGLKDGASQPYIVQAGRTISLTKLMSAGSLATTSEQKKKPRCCCFCFLIHPDSPKLAVWQALMAFAIVYAAIMTPFLLAFQDIISAKDISSGNTLIIVDTVFNVIFMCDIVICFLTMYISDVDGSIVTDPWAIAKRYICTWFFPDLISCVPLDIITQEGFAPGLYAKLARMGKLARVFRLLKVLKIMKLLRLIKYYRQVDNLFQNLLTHNKYEGPPAKMYQFGKFCICAILVSHVAGCIWFAVADFHEVKSETWLERFGVLGDDVALLDQYAASIYFVMTTLTTVGYGDISARTSGEICAAIILMMCGVLGYSMAVGTVSSIMMQDDERQVILESKLTTLAHFAKTTNMDIEEYRKIRRHLTRKYSESLDWMQQLEGPARLASLLEDMPVVLRSKMIRHMHSGRHLDIEFFTRYSDDDFFVITVPLLSSEENEAGDMVYLRGDYAERVYFLTRGTISFLDLDTNALRGIERNNQSTSRRVKIQAGVYEEMEKQMAEVSPFQVVIDGSTFGEFEVLLSLPRQLCVRCETASEMLSLHKKDLLRVLAEFPDISKKMHADAVAEYKATIWRRDKAREEQGLEVENSRNSVNFHAIEEALERGSQGGCGRTTRSLNDEDSQGEPPSLLGMQVSMDARFSNGGTQVEVLEANMNRMVAMEEDLHKRQDKLAGELTDIQNVMHRVDLRIQSMVLSGSFV